MTITVSSTRARAYRAILAVVAIVASSCARAPTTTQPTRPNAPGPKETIKRFIALRAQCKYAEIERLIVPEQAVQVSTFLLRVDGFLEANNHLCALVRDRVAVGVSKQVDQSDLARALGLFGASVELLEEHVSGERAVVTYIADGRMPPEQVDLRRIDGEWRLDPGAGFTPLLTEAFAALADGLNQLSAEIESGKLTPQEMLADTERLPRKVQSAMRRGVDLLSKARATAGASSDKP